MVEWFGGGKEGKCDDEAGFSVLNVSATATTKYDLMGNPQVDHQEPKLGFDESRVDLAEIPVERVDRAAAWVLELEEDPVCRKQIFQANRSHTVTYKFVLDFLGEFEDESREDDDDGRRGA